MSENNNKVNWKSSEEKAKYFKEYYQKNKQKFQKRDSEKINCEHCKRWITKKGWAIHCKTEKHRKNAMTKEQSKAELLLQQLLKSLPYEKLKEIEVDIQKENSA